ncbi:hypothetical protein KSP40_PGU006132 [Platanthera guangdongensis]|uniref:Uncharacterized protein n=1 Tax=Platanthera guangdongensis TaxID=2320717 RepID=A0ABR2MI85_9ASPA
MCAPAAGVDPAAFERLFPSRFLSFSFPNPLPFPGNPYDATLRIAVADSPSPSPKDSSPAIAAVLVPHSRDDDWIFSTPAGHFQLLLVLSSSSYLPISRLIIIGDLPASSPLPRSYSRPQPESNRSSLDCFQESILPSSSPYALNLLF